MSDISMSEESEFVDSEEEKKPRSKASKARKGTTQRNIKKRATERSKKLEAPRVERKRKTSRILPSAPKSESPPAAPKHKKQKTQASNLRLSQEGQRAVALVDAEILKLPPVDELDFSEMDRGGALYGFPSQQVPELHGQKPVPEAQEECLSGKTFVITGLLESLTREEATDLIQRYGGRVTSAVSGKTTFLLVGKESGKSKCDKVIGKQAKGLGTIMIDENGLFQLLKAADRSLFIGHSTAAEPEGSKGESSSQPKEANVLLGQELWVDKYKPKDLSELVGNPSIVKFIQEWLEEWRSVHIFHQTTLSSIVPGANKMTDTSSRKALLLSGSPGIGKTTAALLAAEQAGFDAVEVNASDTRNKADKIGKTGINGKMANRIQALCQSHPVNVGDSDPLVLIMDEVDGMSAGDRGGVMDLITNIKKTKIPIICICNDKYNRKLSSLKSHCIELDFRKPTRVQISKRLVQICEKEGLSFRPASAMDALIDQAFGDIRTLIGGLQFIRAQTNIVTYDDIRSGKYSISKHKDVSPFETTRALLSPESATKSWSELSDLVFADADLIPLLVQENYINHIPQNTKSEKDRFKAMAKAAEFISFAERFNVAVRSNQQWSLMPHAIGMGTLAPAAIMRGQREAFNAYEPNFPRFTSFLGNLSTTNKQKRLLQSTATRITAATGFSMDKDAAVMEVLPVLRHLITKPLIEDGVEGVPEAIEWMQSYGIDKDHFDFLMDVTQFKSKAAWAADPLQKIAPKVKAALTRAAKAKGLTLTPFSEASASNVKVEDTPDDSAALASELGIIPDVVVEEEKEEEGVDDQKVVTTLKDSGYNVEVPEKKPERRTSSVSTRGKGRSRGRRASGSGEGRQSGRP